MSSEESLGCPNTQLEHPLISHQFPRAGSKHRNPPTEPAKGPLHTGQTSLSPITLSRDDGGKAHIAQDALRLMSFPKQTAQDSRESNSTPAPRQNVSPYTAGHILGRSNSPMPHVDHQRSCHSLGESKSADASHEISPTARKIAIIDLLNKTASSDEAAHLPQPIACSAPPCKDEHQTSVSSIDQQTSTLGVESSTRPSMTHEISQSPQELPFTANYRRSLEEVVLARKFTATGQILLPQISYPHLWITLPLLI